MAPHEVDHCERLPDGEWQFDCVCGAIFRSPDVDEVSEAFRQHMSEPAFPSEAQS